MDSRLIKRIVVVMMENRSFDNLLGYLSLPPLSRKDVEGLGRVANWKELYASVYQGQSPLQHAFHYAFDQVRKQPIKPQGKLARVLAEFPPRGA